MQTDHLGSSHRRIAVAAVGLAIFWLVIGMYAVHAVQPANPVTLPLEGYFKPVFRAALTQGWGFFTKSPRDEDFYLYVRDKAGRWLSVFRGPESEPANLFGLSRLPRAQGIEYGLLSQEVAWQSCQEEPTICLTKIREVKAVSNTSPQPTLCGTVGFVSREPIPWAWSRSASKDLIMPSRVARLEVSCP